MEIIERKTLSGVVILYIQGGLNHVSFEKLHVAVSELLAKNELKIILNLSKCRITSSEGLGELVRSHINTKQAKGKLKLLHAPHDILVITKLNKVFETYETEREALASFQK